MKTYILTVEIDEGCDEFWEDVAKGKSRSKVRDAIVFCLAEEGFVKPNCRVKIEDVITSRR